MQPYAPEIEQQMRRFYQSLSEKDRRRSAAVEAFKLGWGGITYIRQLFQCDDQPMRDGLKELEEEQALRRSGIRQAGGGRKSTFETIEGLDAAFLSILSQHTAGSPMDATVKWTNLTRQEIAQLLQAAGIEVSVTVVDQLLKKHHYRKRKAQKTTGNRHPSSTQ